MYLSAQTLNLKLNQDSSNFSINEGIKRLAICDGIGEFPLSHIVSEKVCEVLIENQYNDLNSLFTDESIVRLKDLESDAGTTIIFCTINNDLFRLQHLGNGGCIHFEGDFAMTRENLPIYRFHDLINPHVNVDGVLTKHLSKQGGKIQRKRTEISLQMNGICGDIFLLYSDGINSAESNVIIQDDHGRFWRNESNSVMFILKQLDEFLTQNNDESNFQDSLIDFNLTVLKKLKELEMLDDDSSLGIVVTANVLSYYNKKSRNE